MDALQLDYPTSYLFLCAGIALVYGLVLYFRDQRWKEKSAALPWILGVLRSVVVFILCLLLLSPFLTYFEEKTENPLVILAVDDSESLTVEEDSVLQRVESLPQLVQDQLQDFDHLAIKFGESVSSLDSLSFSQPKTNLSAVLDYARNDLRGRNIGGLILASDGMYNLGQNPIYALSGLNFPIFPIALGDTSKRKDISLVDVFHNDIAYLGDKFIVQADVKASSCLGDGTSISLFSYDGNRPKRLARQDITINTSDYFQTFSFTIEPEKAGVQKYSIVVDPVPNETTNSNNSKTFYIDVINARKKILIAGGAPHPDITAFKQVLNNNKNYEVDVILARDALPNIATYDLAILHQLPFKKFKPDYLEKLLDSDLPKLFVTGSDTDFNQLNQLKEGIKIKLKRGSANAVTPALNPNFNAFSFSEENAKALTNYPPLESAFADYQMTSGGQAIFYQQIGEVSTEYPLILIGRNQGKSRTAFLLGEGYWRWRLYEYERSEDRRPADQLLSQIAQYLSVADDKRRFRTQIGKNVYDENERIQMRAEFYNQNYELTNSSDAFLEVTSDNGETYQYTLGKKADYYQLNVGFLPEGEYNYTATLDWNGERFTHRGQFVVKEIQLELFRTQADHNLLRQIANETGGAMISLNQLDLGMEAIQQSETARPILYAQPTTRGLINLPWVFALIMILLALEWFVRRWVGSY